VHCRGRRFHENGKKANEIRAQIERPKAWHTVIESNEDNALFHYDSAIWQTSKPVGDNDYSLRATQNDINRVHQV
jgi:hypothetical protein